GDEAGVSQLGQRLAHRHPADVVLARQLGLALQQAAPPQITRGDASAEVVGEVGVAERTSHVDKLQTSLLQVETCRRTRGTRSSTRGSPPSAASRLNIRCGF